uniref:Fibrinogen C-terminal domain-containing protein n=1 Tax=Ditylenchus dipsaci TaxID=166011 RepID=A0A915CVG0_9BILA
MARSKTIIGLAVGVSLVLLSSLSILLYFLLHQDADMVEEEEWICSSVYQRDRCLKVIYETSNWKNAEQYCLDEQQQDAYLLSIANLKEQKFVKDLLRRKSASSEKCNNFWLGAEWNSTAQQFQWIDGQPFSSFMYRTHHISNKTTSNHGSDELESRRLAFNTKSFHWVVQNQDQPNCFVCLWNSRESVKNASDCQDLKKAGKSRNGLYKINLIDQEKVESHKIVCDMENSGGGWTVFQQRLDGKLVFWNKTWEEFKNGFGEKSLHSEFWLGNELLHRLSTNHPSVNLKVQLWGDRNPYSNKYTNDYLESDYTDFRVGDESTSYTFNAATQWPNNGNASGGWFDITCASGAKFSTVDRINDPLKTCVHDFHLGGWWLHYCTFAALNGEYDPPIGWADGYGMMWLANGIYIINPRKTRLMFRKNT